MHHEHILDVRHRIDFDKVVERTADELLSSADEGSLIAFEYAASRDIEDPDRFAPRSRDGFDEDFRDFARMRAHHLVAEAIEHLLDVIEHDGWMVVHRAMVVVPQWFDIVPNERDLGLCWAWSEEEAVAHDSHRFAGKEGLDVRLRGFVHVDGVDWNETVVLNAADDYVTGTENEIRLIPGTLVELDRIEWREDPRGRYREFDPEHPPSDHLAQAAMALT